MPLLYLIDLNNFIIIAMIQQQSCTGDNLSLLSNFHQQSMIFNT